MPLTAQGGRCLEATLPLAMPGSVRVDRADIPIEPWDHAPPCRKYRRSWCRMCAGVGLHSPLLSIMNKYIAAMQSMLCNVRYATS